MMHLSEYCEKFNEKIVDEELQQAFIKKCQERIKEIDEYTNHNQELNEKLFDSWFNMIMEYSLEKKKQALIEDLAYNELYDISMDVFNKSYQFAQCKTDNHCDINLNDKLNQLYQNVRDFNKEKAKALLEEALKEIEYLGSNDENKMSLRLFKISHPEINID